MKPSDFKITDISEQTKTYCAKRGSEYLAEMFYPEFIEWWENLLADGRKPVWKSPDLALKNWVGRESPARKGYTSQKWERALKKCKDKLNKQAIPDYGYKPKSTPKPISEESKQRAKVAIHEAMKGLMG